MRLDDFLFLFLPAKDNIPVVIMRGQEKLYSLEKACYGETHIPEEIKENHVDWIKANKTEIKIYVRQENDNA